ncbi:MAG: hypothetical protein IPM26_06240 [Saprospiraceae bacterium]|nr:hypothetical protein [Saprospiraceae bacterium]
MATTTAIILTGTAHRNHSGISPAHLIQLTENSRPALILQSMDGKDKPITIIPTIENMLDDVFLMISVLILKSVDPGKELYTQDRKSLYEILSDIERFELYEKAKGSLQTADIKVVFNLLEGCHLLHQIDKIDNYPCDFEVTVPKIKREFNAWSGKIEFKEF